MSEKPDVHEGVFRRGSRLWVRYYGPDDEGHWVQIREPAKRPDGTPAQTPKEAVKYRERRLRAAANHRSGVQPFQGPRAERLPLTDLLDAYQRQAEIQALKSLPQIRSRVRRLRLYFAGYRALAVTHDTLLRYVQVRHADGAANATVNRELEVIQRAYALASVDGKLNFAPVVPSLPEHNARRGFFERADFEVVSRHLGDDDVRDFLEWFFWTGMRPGEIRSLTWAAFDRETWTLRLHAAEAKTGHGRVLALMDGLRAVIERRLKARRLECPLIFHRNGRPLGEFCKTWANACKAAGLAVTVTLDGKTITRPLKRVYDLRRTSVRNMVRAGVPESTKHEGLWERGSPSPCFHGCGGWI